jgi:hypothetical protein
MLVTGLALAAAACSQEDAPAEKVAEVAEEIVEPAAAEPTPLASGEWAPQDECGEIEGAGTFRQILSAAVRARDTDVLVAIAAEDIKLDFGGGAGKAELRRRLEDETRDLWGELDALLALGCSANDQGGITMPWYFDQDLGAADPFTAWLVAGENVPVYAGAGADSRQLGTISWDLVEIAEVDPEAARQRAELADGTVAFIPLDRLRSVIDYRLIASSRNGRWRITSLVAGD